MESQNLDLLTLFEMYDQMVDVLKISAFAQAKKEEDKGLDMLTLLRLVSLNPFNNEKTLFVGCIPCCPIVDKEGGAFVEIGASSENIFNRVLDKLIYKHQWYEGDLLIWDNL